MMTSVSRWLALVALAGLPTAAWAQAPAEDTAETADDSAPERGSLIEDRAARKLLEAGDLRLEADEPAKAVEIWQSVIERYPKSRVRFEAHMRLGNYLLDKERAYDRARAQFEPAASEENRDEGQRAEATLKIGMCHYEARDFGKCFQVMRDVIELFPISGQVNQAYYYIGLAHFQLGHYSRAIAALEKVGTTLSLGEDSSGAMVEAGKRLFVKIEDADLAVLEPNQAVEVVCETEDGDRETVQCFPVGRNVRIVLGSILTALGKPAPNNRRLELRGGTEVKVRYVDAHTADREFDRPLEQQIAVVGDALVRVTDGAFGDTLHGIVLDRVVHVEVVDADFDISDAADTLQATVEVYREKTQEEYEAEVAALEAANPAGVIDSAEDAEAALDAEEQLQVSRFKLLDTLQVTLTEVAVERDGPTLPVEQEEAAPSAPPTGATEEAPAAGEAPAAAPAEEPAGESPTDSADPASATVEAGPSPASADDGSIHSGVFRATVPLVRAEEVAEDDQLQALPNDVVHVTYLDERNMTGGARTLVAKARCLEGNLGGVRVTRAEITDRELEIQTKLRTADALTNIGNRYKEFGLKTHADAKYQQALEVCEEVSEEAMQLGGRLLEETYVQLWKIYYERDHLDLAAAMCERLQREFPNSGFVDDALLQLADVSRKQGDLQRAIGIYSRLVAMTTSQLRGDAQFGIAECYEDLAKQNEGPAAAQLYDRAFHEYKKVFDGYPDSGRVGEAVAKMANYYYQQKDYARAIDVFETVLNEHPDAKFLDVILFNYGRCLYRMDRKGEARRQFDQLIAEFPESPLAADAKKISEALAQSPAG
jgi:TolA-binding protein